MWRMDIGTCSYINISTTEESQEGLNSWEGAGKEGGRQWQRAAASKPLPAAIASRLPCPLLPSYSGLPGFPPPWRL